MNRPRQEARSASEHWWHANEPEWPLRRGVRQLDNLTAAVVDRSTKIDLTVRVERGLYARIGHIGLVYRVGSRSAVAKERHAAASEGDPHKLTERAEKACRPNHAVCQPACLRLRDHALMASHILQLLDSGA